MVALSAAGKGKDAMGWMPAIAAAAKRRREEQEESTLMERLRSQDAEGRFEFKILRSYSFAFAGRERIRSVLDEEARAGWELAEKLDSGRLVLRRPRSKRDSDRGLPAGLDPYRTRVDPNLPLIIAPIVVGLLMCALLWEKGPLAASAPVLILLALAALAAALFVLRARLHR